MSIDDFLAKLEGVQAGGGGWVARFLGAEEQPSSWRGAVIFMNSAKFLETQSVRTVCHGWKVARRANFCDGIGEGIDRQPFVLRSGGGHAPVWGCFDLFWGTTSPRGLGSSSENRRDAYPQKDAGICECNAVTRFKCSRFSWKAVRCEQG